MEIEKRIGMSVDNDDVGRELIASALLVLFVLGTTGLLLGTALGAVWLLG